jgi:outer membrane immunogenic protein
MRIKSLLIAAMLALASASAFATDLPNRVAAPAPVYVAPPAPIWTGLYVGVNAGAQFADPTSLSNLGSVLNPSAVSFAGGGQLGYNVQFDRIVLGVETDVQGITKASTIQGVIAGTPSLATLVSTAQSTGWLGTTRLRAGVLLTPTFLAYGTGGVAYGNSSLAVTAGNLLGGFYNTVDQVQVGWTAGGGVEWLIVPQWSVKAEYLHYNLGTTVANIAGIGSLTGGTAANLGRVGVSYHF